MKKLYKSTKDNVLTGILGGLSTYLGVDSTVLRVIFMILLVLTGFFPFGIIYIIAYFLIPNQPPHNTVSEQ
jgi:phage shock protein PspC (stress-responsive transcriptional regulator)